ncbi:succinylglutamate desuccinylase/aspartoacylase domain-containing protein [Caenimonas aquaedulcis]|uniref:Succinylglutamate desuccinylase/aspartoacylase family protein n=1 Tax=Caenimonas aquaedulcis TaxID=2793270 RepID=A0A931H8M8_9BURK|nr:succinylglutamate desuccinylase/aspartoacylase family protein [Caenimonas aquaedulcis]MBG9390568.1 succinylglutamate desuccinylase/aspartoacylase family protein [Caenimonas aquaedulcis]
MITITLEDGTRQSLPPVDAVGGSNCGTAGIWRFDSGAPGPHVAITALIHGNEVCGVQALYDVLQAAPAVARGRLTLAFCNLEAYARLDDANKDERRLVDEDLNRVWGRLEGPGANGDTYEVRRAREIVPWVQDADVLVDLHSMTGAAPALGLVGLAAKNVELARRIGYPALLVRDAGHAAGLRLIDRHPFGDAGAAPTAMLVECGQHFSREAFDAAKETVARTLSVFLDGKPTPPAAPQSVIEVVEAVTIRTGAFEFTQDWPNMAVVPKAGTLVGRDGEREVRTPHDETYLVMPASPRFRKPGLTAVRFGRRV